jgi:hypothetical protein
MALALPNLPNQPKAQLYSLISKVTAANGQDGRFVDQERDDQIIVNFPNLPDEIDLMRTSEWRVTQSPLLPDGFHMYDHTSPLELPFTFKVHAFDDYAVNGPETILQIAAKLHALQLPIINSRQSGKITRDSGTVEQSGTDSAKQQKGESPNTQELGSTFAVADGQYGTNYYFPPACVLNLMIGSGGPQALGICCIGYVKNVSTKLKGPWLNSGRADVNRNLPSSGEFAFTFVHAPSYTNSLNFDGDNKLLTAQVGAYRMKNSFYNTIDILSETGVDVGYKGLK